MHCRQCVVDRWDVIVGWEWAAGSKGQPHLTVKNENERTQPHLTVKNDRGSNERMELGILTERKSNRVAPRY